MRQESAEVNREFREALADHAADNKAEFQQFRLTVEKNNVVIERGVGVTIALRWVLAAMVGFEALLHVVQAVNR